MVVDVGVLGLFSVLNLRKILEYSVLYADFLPFKCAVTHVLLTADAGGFDG